MKLIPSTLAAALVAAFTLSSALADAGVPKNYPLQTCVVSGDQLGEEGTPVKAVAPDGTVVYLCCRSCKKAFDKDPAKFTKKVKEAQPKK